MTLGNKKIGRAGTVESNDISIVIEPSDKKILKLNCRAQC